MIYHILALSLRLLGILYSCSTFHLLLSASVHGSILRLSIKTRLALNHRRASN